MNELFQTSDLIDMGMCRAKERPHLLVPIFKVRIPKANSRLMDGLWLILMTMTRHVVERRSYCLELNQMLAVEEFLLFSSLEIYIIVHIIALAMHT